MGGYGGNGGDKGVSLEIAPTISRGIDRNNPRRKEKKSIGFSRTVNTLVLDITKSITNDAVKSDDINAVNIKNIGRIPTFIMLGYRLWDGSASDGGNNYHLNYILKPGDELYLPTIRGVISDETIEPLVGTVVTDVVPDANMYLDSTANTDNETATDNIIGDNDDTTLYLEPHSTATDCTANMFRVGDLIRCTNEIMEVTAIGTKADLANNTLTVKRGMYGSAAAADHADADAVTFAFFNAYHDFDKYSVAQTDSQGRFKCFNMFGVGRAATALQGITPGSFSVQFYEAGYQELGLSGITSSTNSSLTAGGSYWFKIAIDGGTAEQINFTVDSSNTNWGGNNGIISLINSALVDKYDNSASNTFQKKSSVEIVGGDIRFTSGTHLATSAIALTAGVDGASASYNLFAQQNGHIPALANLDAAVAAKLAPTTTYDPVTYASSYKEELFVYDDGIGKLFGKARGTINYESGALDMVGCPPNAQFVVTFSHSGCFSGKQDATETAKMNSLQKVYANIPSQKWAGEIEIETF